jgi:hypothetical protein
MEFVRGMDNPDNKYGAFEPVEVEYYAGCRGRETPRRLLFRGRPVPVLEVLSRKLIQDHATGRRIEVFELRLPETCVTLRVDEDGRAEMAGGSRPGD